MGASTIKIHLYDDGEDRLRVEASRTVSVPAETVVVDEDGNSVTVVDTVDVVESATAFGWVSWTKKFWTDEMGVIDPETGQLHGKDRRRAMKPAEVREYALELLAEQNPGWLDDAAAPAQPKPLHSFEV